jgi:hypothetical protein
MLNEGGGVVGWWVWGLCLLDDTSCRLVDVVYTDVSEDPDTSIKRPDD